MAKKRRTFTREFKLEAVRLVLEEGMAVAQVARDLGIGETALARWRDQVEVMRTNCDLQLPLPEWPAYGKDLGNTRGPSVWSFSEGPPRDDLVGMEAPVTLGNVTPIPTMKGQRVTLEAAAAQDVTLEIYDVAGRLVRRLLKGRIESGTTVVDWNGNDEDGTRAESGIYWYRLRWSTGVEARRVVVLH